MTNVVFNTSASLGYYCHPPTSWTLSSHFNESIVTDMKWGFNLEELEKNNAHSIQGKHWLCLTALLSCQASKGLIRLYWVCLPFLAIKGPRLAGSILFQSSGLTNGIIEEGDIPEEPLKQKEQKQEEGEDYGDVDTDQESVDKEGDVSMLYVHELIKFLA